MGVNDLAKRWHEEAWAQVPPEYAGRDLHGKYLKCDNHAGGMEDAADELEDVARSAWHFPSEPPTAEDGDRVIVIPRWVVAKDGAQRAHSVYRGAVNPSDHALWARIRDVVLLPPEAESVV